MLLAYYRNVCPRAYFDDVVTVIGMQPYRNSPYKDYKKDPKHYTCVGLPRYKKNRSGFQRPHNRLQEKAPHFNYVLMQPAYSYPQNYLPETSVLCNTQRDRIRVPAHFQVVRRQLEHCCLRWKRNSSFEVFNLKIAFVHGLCSIVLTENETSFNNISRCHWSQFENLMGCRFLSGAQPRCEVVSLEIMTFVPVGWNSSAGSKFKSRTVFRHHHCWVTCRMPTQNDELRNRFRRCVILKQRY